MISPSTATKFSAGKDIPGPRRYLRISKTSAGKVPNTLERADKVDR